MDKIMKKFLGSSIITSLILAALGILLIFQSEATIITISYAIGGILIGLGVVGGIKFIKNIDNTQKDGIDLVYGVVSVVLGVIVIKNPGAIASTIPIILGISIIISSAMKMQYAFELRAGKNHLWKTTMIISIISILCGLVLLFNPFKVVSYFTKMVGIFIVIYALLDITSTLTIKKNAKRFEKTIEKDVTEAEIIEEIDAAEEEPDDKTSSTKKKKKK